VNFFVGAFYDGVYLLGMALNETLSEGEDIHNGTAITRRMWNRDFHGEFNTAHNMRIYAINQRKVLLKGVSVYSEAIDYRI
jgi:Receptor family ligand binding region.